MQTQLDDKWVILWWENDSLKTFVRGDGSVLKCRFEEAQGEADTVSSSGEMSDKTKVYAVPAEVARKILGWQTI